MIKFFQLVRYDIYGDQYGEFVGWHKGSKGYTYLQLVSGLCFRSATIFLWHFCPPDMKCVMLQSPTIGSAIQPDRAIYKQINKL